MVGYALHSLRSGSGIPWHRVVNAQGRISLPKANGAYREQKRLLIGEGVAFVGERIDLERFSWLSSVRRKKVTR